MYVCMLMPLRALIEFVLCFVFVCDAISFDVRVCSASAKVLNTGMVEITVQSRASAIQPHRFKKFKINVCAGAYMGEIREKAYHYIHSDTDMPLDDSLVLTTIKLTDMENTSAFHYANYHPATLDCFMNNNDLVGDKLTMTMMLDGYGEGGGKRVPTSVFSELLICALYCD